MDATNEKMNSSEALVVLLRAEERAERAAKTFQGPEREKLRAAAASVRELVGKIDLTVVDAIADVGGSVEEAAEGAGA